MEQKQSDNNKIERQAARFEMIEGLERALDLAYRRVVRAALLQWERRFAGKDPSDDCVSVRVRQAAPEKRPVPASGFLKVRGKPVRQPKVRLPFPRLAP